MELVTVEQKTYKTRANAVKALQTAVGTDRSLDSYRWLIGVAPNGRFVPVLVGIQYVSFAHRGIVIVG